MPSSFVHRIPVCLALALVAASASAAQPPAADQQMPSASSVAAAEKAVRPRIVMPTDAQMRGAAQSLPRLPDSPAARVDLEAIARSYERKPAQPEESAADPVPSLIVFVSLDMPEASLKRLVEDAERARAVLILRGLRNRSLKATTQAIQAINGTHKTAWQIDPRLFEAYDVKAVPVTVLMDPTTMPSDPQCGAPGCLKARHVRLTGDVSLEHALRSMEGADPVLRPLAHQHLQRLASASFMNGGKP